MTSVGNRVGYHGLTPGFWAEELALQRKMTSTSLRMLITIKQKMPKLCMGRRVCQTSLLGSTLVHTGNSVIKNRKSTMKRMMTEPRTCV